MHVFISPHELLSHAGLDLGYSSWHVITQNHINEFAKATGDQQWIHTDPVAAQTGPFGKTIAHGFLSLSMIPQMLWEVSRVDNAAMVINYGLNKVRFPSPVIVDSKVRAHVVIGEVSESSKGILAQMDVTIDIEAVDKPACVAQMLTLYTT